MHEYMAAGIAPADRASYWTRSVTETLFPLAAEVCDPARFFGHLRKWEVGAVGLSHFVTGGVRYRREKQHMTCSDGEEILISFSLNAKTSFAQNGITLDFKKNEFVIQRSGMTYEFGHSDENELFVLKVRTEDLKRHVRSIERFTPMIFNASSGMGCLLLDMVRSLPERLAQSDPRLRPRLGGLVVELLGLALEADDRMITSRESTVQRAHLGRIELHIRQNIQKLTLSAETIAAACGISVRYLHELSSHDGETVGSRIRRLRLEAAREQICDPLRKETIAETAYRWGFRDQAKFSRHYKRFFGETPRESKARAAPQ